MSLSAREARSYEENQGSTETLVPLTDLLQQASTFDVLVDIQLVQLSRILDNTPVRRESSHLCEPNSCQEGSYWFSYAFGAVTVVLPE